MAAITTAATTMTTTMMMTTKAPVDMEPSCDLSWPPMAPHGPGLQTCVKPGQPGGSGQVVPESGSRSGRSGKAGVIGRFPSSRAGVGRLERAELGGGLALGEHAAVVGDELEPQSAGGR